MSPSSSRPYSPILTPPLARTAMSNTLIQFSSNFFWVFLSDTNLLVNYSLVQINESTERYIVYVVLLCHLDLNNSSTVMGDHIWLRKATLQVYNKWNPFHANLVCPVVGIIV